MRKRYRGTGLKTLLFGIVYTREERRRQVRLRFTILVLLATALFCMVTGHSASSDQKKEEGSSGFEAVHRYTEKGDAVGRPEIQVDLLDPNPYSRPQNALEEVKGVVIHYTANPGSSAKANRDYFNNLGTTHDTSASSHFVVGLQGEIVQCIPCSEISYASNHRNKDTISIECCIEEESGKFNEQTYDTVVHLTAWLVLRYHLKVEDVIRHYDVTGKACPKYFVDHPDAWEQFRTDLSDYIEAHGSRFTED